MPDSDLVSRLRHGAANIHSIGPVRAAALLEEAAGALEAAESKVANAVLAVERAANPPPIVLMGGQPVDGRRTWPTTIAAAFEFKGDPALSKVVNDAVLRHSLDIAKRTDALLAILAPGQRLAVSAPSATEPTEFLFLEDGSDPPLGKAWTVYTAPNVPDEVRARHREQAERLLGLDEPDSTMAPKGARLEVVGGDPETIRALGLPEPINQLRTRRLYSTPPEGPLAPIDLVVLPPAPAPAKPLVSIVLPALRFEDKRITSSNTLSVLCGDREVWTGNGTCELDIRTTVVENQISYAHPLTFDGMMEAKGTLWLQANDEAAALLRTFKGSSVRLVLRLTGGESTVTASLCDLPDGHEAPSAVGWAGFGIVVEGK